MKILRLIPVLLVMFSCSITRTKNGDKGESKLKIGYNENIETIALIYNLSESGDYHFNEIVGPRGILAKELTMQFEEYKNHEAVKKLNKLLDDGFVDMYDIILSLYNTSLPEFKQYAKYPSIYYENDGLTAEETQSRFDDFNKSVIQFYIDVNLNERFENDFLGLYKKLMEEVQSVAPTDKFISAAEEYYGIQRDSYEIIVSAFSYNGIGKAQLISSLAGTNAISLVTSNHLIESDSINLNDLNSFVIGYNDEKYFQEIGLHELIHTFYQEALKENKENIKLIDELEYLFSDSLKKDMLNQGYTDWRTCFEEHLVRIGEIKIAEQLGKMEFVSQYRKECINKRGFSYFELIENLFKDYENNRSIYRNIGEFVPELVHKLKLKVPNSVYKK
jgi:hypothetical protein